jgi:hypothetical protein
VAPTQATPLPQILRELWDLLVAYAKQETIDPLRDLGRWLAWGLAGSILLMVGVPLLALAVLRGLQTQTGDTFAGAWSVVPYVIVVVLLAGVAAASIFTAQRPHSAAERTEVHA